MSRPSGLVIISDDDATASSDTPASVQQVIPRKRKSKHEVAVKFEWSDDSDNVYEAFKRHKGAQKPATKAKGKAAPKGRLAKDAKLDKTKTRLKDDTASSSDADLPEDAIPQYVQKRRRSFDERRRVLREGGLRLPPDYSDVYFSDDERLQEIEEKPKFDRSSGVKPCQPYKDVILRTSGGVIPASIAQYLRDYQIQGTEFLHHLFVYQKGGILGDDMGLGKTVQVAAFLTAAFGKTGDHRDAKRMRKYRRTKDDWYPRVLIICPGSLIQNWKNELNRWGWWEVDLFHGAGKDDVLGTARAGRLEVMITTYSTYKNSCSDINMVPWDVVVADECHTIKTVSAETTKAMNKVNALCRIGLTGTAIQNTFEELWTLLNWTNPGKISTIKDWRSQVCKPLTIGQSRSATERQKAIGRLQALNLRDNLLPPYFRRRTKKHIADQLPKKSDKVVFCPLSDFQREAYENLLASDIVAFVLAAFDTCSCGSEKKRGSCCFQVNSDGESWRSLVFPIIISLQKLSNHFNLIIPRTSEVPDKQGREIRFLQAAMPKTWMQHYNNRDSMLNLANPEYCGKWKVLRKLLKFWHSGGNKVLVFSHSVRFLRILHQLFSNTSYSVSYLDGSLSYEERQNVVDDFNSDPNQFVFLISTKAGGVGLNITSANKVVIMDPHWNPSYDLQAQDRAYRIGQVRDVDVYRLVSTGTIEEITYARQIYKQQQANIGYTASNERRLFEGVQQDPDRKGEIFGIRNLLTYTGDNSLLRDIINKTNIAEAKVGVLLMDVDMNKVATDAEDDQAVKNEEGTDDDDTGGIKQLAALLTREDNKNGLLVSERAPKAGGDPIQAILASAGVDYSHENSEVIGSSKIEEKLSRQAEMAIGNNGEMTSHAAFFDVLNHAVSRSFDYEYSPPEDVKRRQFCTMAATFGFSSATDFALAIESMTLDQRQNCLDLFYNKRAEKLRDRRDVKSDVKDEDVKDEDVKDGVKFETKHGEANDDDVKMEGIEVYDVETSKNMVIETASRSKSVGERKKNTGDVKAIKTEDVSTEMKRHLASIWVSDDDETDEL